MSAVRAAALALILASLLALTGARLALAQANTDLPTGDSGTSLAGGSGKRGLDGHVTWTLHVVPGFVWLSPS